MTLFVHADDPFTYRTAFDANLNPGPLAVDSDGGLYYATFDGSSTALYYVPDPIAGSGLSNHIQVYNAGSGFASGRGFQGLATYGDYVYVCGDTGSTSVFKKFVKNPGTPITFTDVSAFAPNLSGKRYSGVAVIGDSGTTVAVTTHLGCVDLLEAADGDLITLFCGAKNYQRDLVADQNGDLFCGRNGLSDGAAVNLYDWSGSDYNFTKYNDYITTGAIDTSSGESLQGIGYSSNLDRLFVARRTAGPYLPGWNEAESVMIYDPAVPGTIIQEITTGTGYPEAGIINDVGDCAAWYDGSSADVLFVSDTTQNIIYVFQNNVIAAVRDWMLLEF